MAGELMKKGGFEVMFLRRPCRNEGFRAIFMENPAVFQV